MTPQQRAQYDAWRIQAEKAFVDLTIGGQVRVFVDQNGERIEYGSTNSYKLLSFINWLRGQLGMCEFSPYNVLPPAGVRF